MGHRPHTLQKQMASWPISGAARSPPRRSLSLTPRWRLLPPRGCPVYAETLSLGVTPSDTMSAGLLGTCWGFRVPPALHLALGRCGDTSVLQPRDPPPPASSPLSLDGRVPGSGLVAAVAAALTCPDHGHCASATRPLHVLPAHALTIHGLTIRALTHRRGASVSHRSSPLVFTWLWGARGLSSPPASPLSFVGPAVVCSETPAILFLPEPGEAAAGSSVTSSQCRPVSGTGEAQERARDRVTSRGAVRSHIHCQVRLLPRVLPRVLPRITDHNPRGNKETI